MRRDFQSRRPTLSRPEEGEFFLRLYGLQKLISDLPPIPPYSLFNIDNLQQRGNVNLPNYTIVLQWDYRIQLNDWAYFQAFVQYFIQPNGMVQVTKCDDPRLYLRRRLLVPTRDNDRLMAAF